jgi:hypothetical protein
MAFVVGDRVRFRPRQENGVSDFQPPREGTIDLMLTDRSMVVAVDDDQPVVCSPDTHWIDVIEGVGSVKPLSN